MKKLLCALLSLVLFCSFSLSAAVAETAKEEPSAAEKANQRQAEKGNDAAESGVPVFKVQILASSRVLKEGCAQLKGLTGVDSYQEGGMYKYTVGSSANYNEIYQLRKTLLEKFPEAFIIAFKNGAKIDVREGIREYRANKNK